MKESRLHLEDLDSVDLKIIALLQEDARRSNVSIARQVGLNETTVKKRIARLTDNGVIRVLAAVNPPAVGLTADVLVGICVKPGTIYAVGDALSAMSETIYLGYVSGRFDIITQVLVSDPQELLNFLSTRIAHIDGIVSLETFFIMHNEKIDYEWKLVDRLPGVLDTPSVTASGLGDYGDDGARAATPNEEL